MTRHDDQHDDQAFEAFLKRDSELSQRYQTDSHEDVPDSLDQKILMQARDAVSSKKVVTHSSWWVTWNKPLALAASLMLAFTVIYKVGYQSIDQLATPNVVSTQAKALQPIAPEPVPLDRARTAERVSGDKQLAEAPPNKQLEMKLDQEKPVLKAEIRAEPEVVVQLKPSAPIVVSAPDGFVASAPASALEDKAPAKNGVSDAAGKVATQNTTREAATVVDSITAEDVGKFPDENVAESLQRIPGVEIKRDASARNTKLDKADPEQVLQHIRDLRKQGKKKQADKAWKQFQKDFPDYSVAENDEARGS